MSRSKLIIFYMILSVINGIVPFVIALLVSASGFNALLVWLIASTATFILILLVCSRSALDKMDTENDNRTMRAELEAVFYR